MSNSAQPLVSIIIPNFNYGAFLGQALSSVLAQSYQNWEAIVVDNYSSDNSKEVVRAFDDKRIRLYSFANNGSIAAARNFGTQEAKGSYIAFLDADDLWFSDKLAESVDRLLTGFDLTYHHLRLMDKNSRFKSRIVRARKIKGDHLKDLLSKGNPIATSSVVLSKSILDAVGMMNENKNILGVEDFDTWLKIAAYGGSFSIIAKTLGAYRMHEGAMSRGRTSQKVRLVFEQYLPSLNSQDCLKAESLLNYIEGREAYLRGAPRAEFSHLLFDALFRASFPLKIRAIYMLVVGFRRERMEN